MHRVVDLSTDDGVDMYVWITIISGSDVYCVYFVCKVVVNLGWKETSLLLTYVLRPFCHPPASFIMPWTFYLPNTNQQKEDGRL